VPDLLESLLELQEGRGGPPRAYEPAAASRASNARLRADRRGGSGSGGGGGGDDGGGGEGRSRSGRAGDGWTGRDSWEAAPLRPGSRGGGPRGDRDREPTLSPGADPPGPDRWPSGGLDDALWGGSAESPPLAHVGASGGEPDAEAELGFGAGDPAVLRWGATAKARSRRIARLSRELWPSCLAPLSPAVLAAAPSGPGQGPGTLTLSLAPRGMPPGWKGAPPPPRAKESGSAAGGGRGTARAEAGAPAAAKGDAAVPAPRPALLEWKRSQARPTSRLPGIWGRPGGGPSRRERCQSWPHQ
jgi:hypothetical protein